MKIYSNISNSVDFILRGAKKRRFAAYESIKEISEESNLCEHTNLFSISKKVSI